MIYRIGGTLGRASDFSIVPNPTRTKQKGFLMAKIITLNNITRLDIPPERVLSALPNLESAIVIGYDKDGDEYFASSIANGGTVLWLLERCKKRLLEIDE